MLCRQLSLCFIQCDAQDNRKNINYHSSNDWGSMDVWRAWIQLALLTMNAKAAEMCCVYTGTFQCLLYCYSGQCNIGRGFACARAITCILLERSCIAWQWCIDWQIAKLDNSPHGLLKEKGLFSLAASRPYFSDRRKYSLTRTFNETTMNRKEGPSFIHGDRSSLFQTEQCGR